MKNLKMIRIIQLGLLLMIVCVSFTLASSQKILIKDSFNYFTISRIPCPNNKLIFKLDNSNPILLSITEDSYKIEEIPILKGKKHSRGYTLSKDGNLAYVNNDSIYLYFSKKNKNLLLEKAPSDYPVWSPDSSKIVYSYKEKLIYYDIKTKKKTVLTNGAISNIIWPVNDKIYYIKNDNGTIIVEFNLKTKKERAIANNGFYKDLIFDLKNNLLFYISREETGREGVYKYNIQNDFIENVIEGKFRLFGLLSKNRMTSLCVVDIFKKNQLLSINIDSLEKTIIEEKGVIDAKTTFKGDAVLYEYYSINDKSAKLYLYWF